MRVKVYGGTVSDGDSSLCNTCRFATIVKGSSQRHEIVECDRLSMGRGRITFAVTSCSAYGDKREPTLRDMEDIAWVLRSDPKRKDIGFVRSRDLRPRERVYFDED
jgi:hypothetical protein